MHSAVLLGLLLSPIPPTSPWSSKAGEVPDGERHVVSVTFSMKMTNFAPTPAQTKPINNDAAPSESGPLIPIGSPDVDPAGGAAGPSAPTQPAGPTPIEADPDTDTRPILRELLAAPGPIQPPKQPVDSSAAALLDHPQPIPPHLEPTEPITGLAENVLLDLTEQFEQESKPQADTPDAGATQPRQAAGADTGPPEPGDTPANTQAEPTAQNEPAEDQPADAPPRTAAEHEEKEDDKPAMVYDEESVDQPIAFNKMARPKQPAVSKRLGESGTVRILVEVGRNGGLIRHAVLDDAGYPRLLAAALAALKGSTFHPAEHEGKPVRSTRIIEYRF